MSLEYPIIIEDNTFIENSGYTSSNGITIKVINDFMDEELVDSNLRCGSK